MCRVRNGRQRELDKPSWSNTQRALIIFENEHDESLNVEIPISKWIFDSGREEPYTLSLENDLTISSLRYMDDFQILLMRLARARTSIIIDKDYDSDDIYPEAEPEASFDVNRNGGINYDREYTGNKNEHSNQPVDKFGNRPCG